MDTVNERIQALRAMMKERESTLIWFPPQTFMSQSMWEAILSVESLLQVYRIRRSCGDYPEGSGTLDRRPLFCAGRKSSCRAAR